MNKKPKYSIYEALTTASRDTAAEDVKILDEHTYGQYEGVQEVSTGDLKEDTWYVVVDNEKKKIVGAEIPAFLVRSPNMNMTVPCVLHGYTGATTEDWSAGEHVDEADVTDAWWNGNKEHYFKVHLPFQFKNEAVPEELESGERFLLIPLCEQLADGQTVQEMSLEIGTAIDVTTEVDYTCEKFCSGILVMTSKDGNGYADFVIENGGQYIKMNGLIQSICFDTRSQSLKSANEWTNLHATLNKIREVADVKKGHAYTVDTDTKTLELIYTNADDTKADPFLEAMLDYFKKNKVLYDATEPNSDINTKETAFDGASANLKTKYEAAIDTIQETDPGFNLVTKTSFSTGDVKTLMDAISEKMDIANSKITDMTNQLTVGDCNNVQREAIQNSIAKLKAFVSKFTTMYSDLETKLETLGKEHDSVFAAIENAEWRLHNDHCLYAHRLDTQIFKNELKDGGLFAQNGELYHLNVFNLVTNRFATNRKEKGDDYTSDAYDKSGSEVVEGADANPPAPAE